VTLPEKRSIEDFREYTGRVEPVETEEVRARVKGFLQKIHFKEGTEVKKDHLLYEIDPSTFEADLAKAKAEVTRLQTQVELATGEAERGLRLLRSRAISEEDYQQRLAARNAAQAAWQQAKAAVKSSELELGFTKIRARVDGKIGRTLVTEGNLIGYNQPTLLTTIVKLDPVYIFFEETEQGLEEYDQLVRGKGVKTLAEAKIPVEINLPWEKGPPHKGYLDFRDNKIDAGTGTIQLRGVIPNADRKLTPGQFARVRVPTSSPRPRLLVPERALAQDQSGKYLLVVKSDNIVEHRLVEPGTTVDGKVVIKKGLNPDDRVIVTGLQRARPRMPVEPQMEKN